MSPVAAIVDYSLPEEPRKIHKMSLKPKVTLTTKVARLQPFWTFLAGGPFMYWISKKGREKKKEIGDFGELLEAEILNQI